MTTPNPTAQPLTNPQPKPDGKDELEEQRLQQRRAEEIVAQIPDPSPAPTLPRARETSILASPADEAAHLVGIFEQHLKLLVANVEQMAGMWERGLEQTRATLELMENTARIMQVVIGEAADTQQNLTDAVNRLGVATTAIAQTNIQLQTLAQQMRGQ